MSTNHRFTRRARFSNADDRAMLNYLIGQLRAGNWKATNPFGNGIWEEALHKRILRDNNHTLHSIRDHFRRQIWPFLHLQSISADEKKFLRDKVRARVSTKSSSESEPDDDEPKEKSPQLKLFEIKSFKRTPLPPSTSKKRHRPVWGDEDRGEGTGGRKEAERQGERDRERGHVTSPVVQFSPADDGSILKKSIFKKKAEELRSKKSESETKRRSTTGDKKGAESSDDTSDRAGISTNERSATERRQDHGPAVIDLEQHPSNDERSASIIVVEPPIDTDQPSRIDGSSATIKNPANIGEQSSSINPLEQPRAKATVRSMVDDGTMACWAVPNFVAKVRRMADLGDEYGLDIRTVLAQFNELKSIRLVEERLKKQRGNW